MDEKNKEIKKNKKEQIKKEEKTITENNPKTENKKFEVKNQKTNTKKNTWIGKTVVVVVVLVIAALLTVMIVTSSDPKKTLDGFFTNLKAGDFEKTQEFISGEKLLKEEYDIETQRLFFDKISWKVTKITKENDNATAEVEITNKDFKTVISSYMQKVLKLALSGGNITVEENKNYLMEELKNDQVKTITQTKTIQLVKEDEKWKVVSNDELLNTLLPGFQEFVDSFNN